MNDNTSAFLNKFCGFVQILPNESFFQITNFNFYFNTEFQISAELVDHCGKTLMTFQEGYDIVIKPYFNSIDSSFQLAIEFITNQDFGESLVFLKLTSSGKSIFSYPFFSTFEKQEETSKFYYKNEGYLLGVSYLDINYFQAIRLRCFKNDSDQETQNEEIIQLSGDKFYSRNVTTRVNKFLFYLADFFTFERLIYLLTHNIIYINKQRHTSSPSKISKGERIPDTNIFQIDFDGNPLDEFTELDFQLINELYVVELFYPDNSIFEVEDEISKTFVITFNRNIFIKDDSIKFHLYKNGVLLESVLPVALNKTLKATFSNDFTPGQYYILVDSNKAGCSTPIQTIFWSGFSDPEDWNFTIQDAPEPPNDPYVNISWDDNTTDPKTGNLDNIAVKMQELFTSDKTIIAYSWQRSNDLYTEEYSNQNGVSTASSLSEGVNIFKLFIHFSDGSTIISNYLKYTKITTPELQSFWYRGRWDNGDTIHRPEINCWVDYVNMMENVERFYTGGLQNGCQQIVAISIIEENNVSSCTPN